MNTSIYCNSLLLLFFYIPKEQWGVRTYWSWVCVACDSWLCHSALAAAVHLNMQFIDPVASVQLWARLRLHQHVQRYHQTCLHSHPIIWEMWIGSVAAPCTCPHTCHLWAELSSPEKIIPSAVFSRYSATVNMPAETGPVQKNQKY